jgi:hypothetical protein
MISPNLPTDDRIIKLGKGWWDEIDFLGCI